MDDLLLFTPTKSSHFDKLEDLLKALHKNGLKISPKKCQLFKTDLQYMGNTIFIRNKRVCIRPLRNWIEAIQKQQKAFKEIKCRLQRPPVLNLPNFPIFQPYSDTSKFATGSALYQIQNGQPRLIAYAGKRMLEAAKNYSITELEMCGLAMNIVTFLYLLKKVDFDVMVDHLAIMHIMRRKAEPATTRIKRLIELLGPYSFNLYYIKGKDMVWVTFYLDKRRMKVTLMKLFPYVLH